MPKFDQFYLMTLDGYPPIASQFKAIKWSDMILNCTEGVQFSEARFKLLMSDLIERSIHYENCNNLNPDMPFSQYFKNNEKWVDQSKVFRLIFKEVCDKLASMYSVDPILSNFNANSHQMLIVFNNEKWNYLTMDKKKMINATDDYALTMAKCRNIHIELNWTQTREVISLYIHYETNPYLSQKEMELFPAIFKENYQQYKDQFKQLIFQSIPDGWKKVDRTLTIIKTDLKITHQTTCSEVTDWLFHHYQLAYHCVDNAIHTLDVI